MAIIEGWMPPSRENWELIHFTFQFFPLFASLQWVIGWYGMGKTSTISSLNIPGKIAWFTMEIPSMIILLTILFTLPAQLGIQELPLENRLMAGLYTVHYAYRAILFPLAAPSMSPIHPFIWLSAFSFQVFNAISIGGWLAGYGPTTGDDWSSHSSSYITSARMEAGLMFWALGFLLTIFHDDELREIRRAVGRRLKSASASASTSGKANPEAMEAMETTRPQVNSTQKVYLIPKNGFFKWILYPHYLFEWMEWSGFWLMGGSSFTPGRTFVLNEISTMLPRALQGKTWYEERFGKEKLEGRKALIPGLL